MVVKVVDASALAAILFGEPDAEFVAERLAGAHLTAPILLDFEIANVCLMKCRRHPAQRRSLLAVFRLRGALRIEPIGIDYDATLSLAAETGLTAYDASYLWLARHLGADLVTLDRRLAQAAALS